MRERIDTKTRIESFVSSASGGLATIGSSWQVCHNICLAALALLASIGIVITGMPLLFLFEYNLYFWGAAVLLLALTLTMFLRNPACGSKNVLAFNVGVVIAGTPGQFLGGFQPLFWGVGGVIALTGIVGWWLKRKKGEK